MTAYPISRANLSVAAGWTGKGGELGDGDALLAETHHVVPTPCPVLYEPWAYDVFPRMCSEGAMGGEAGCVFLCSLCKKYHHNYLTASNMRFQWARRYLDLVAWLIPDPSEWSGNQTRQDFSLIPGFFSTTAR